MLNWRDKAHSGAGGAEVWAHRVAEQLALAGHDVTFFSSAVVGQPEYDEHRGVRIIRRGSRITVYREAKKFWREQSGGFDAVIESVNTRPFDCPKFVGDTPLITMIHQLAREVWPHQMPYPLALLGRHVLEPMWLRRYRDVKVITSAKSGAESFREHGLHDVEIIPLGRELPDDLRRYEKEADPTVLFCGRLASNKRPDHAVKAFLALREQIPNAKMWVIGSGEMEAKLKHLAHDRVTFFGHVSQQKKFELMARAHALLVTSVREGWGFVVTEAGAVGTATVGYNVAGLSDSIPAANGVLVEPNPQALAEQLVELLPNWVANGYSTQPVAGGVLPWSEVADRVLAASGVEIQPKSVVDLRKTEMPVGSASSAQ
jgi:glycosyltransferase involved in cell wall biosynthesis